MRKILTMLVLILLLSQSVVFGSTTANYINNTQKVTQAGNIPETTKATEETDCDECEEGALVQEELHAINGIYFTTYKPDEFEGVVTLNIRNMNTGDVTSVKLSPENDYKDLIEYSSSDISVNALLESRYNFDFYTSVIIGDICEKGYLAVDVVIDYNLINTEQEDGAFDVDESYLKYIEGLIDVPEDFGLSEDTQISNPNKAVKQHIEEYESEQEEKEIERMKEEENSRSDAVKAVKAVKAINSNGLYIGIFIGLGIIVLIFFLVVLYNKWKNED